MTDDERSQLENEGDGADEFSIIKSRGESLALKCLSASSHVVDCVECIESKHGDALILPYFPKSLHELLTDDEPRALSFSELDRVARSLFQALVDASACGPNGGIKIVHGDIKPANILIAEQDGQIVEAKLADFGSAFFLNEAGDLWHPFEGHQLLDKSYFGTAGWVAPEVALTDCQEKARFGQKIDVWAVGLVIYNMWTKEPLLLGDESYGHSIELPARILGRLPQNLVDDAKERGLQAEMFNPELLIGLEENLPREALVEKQDGLKGHLQDGKFTGRLLGDDPEAQRYEIELFTRFLVQVLDTNPDTRLDPQQARAAWEEVSQAINARLDGAF